MKILLVDDDAGTRKLMKSIVPEGVSVIEACNGLEAYDVCREGLEKEEPIDLIFLDIMMPELDGQEFLVGLRDVEEAYEKPLGQGSAVVMVTSKVETDDMYYSMAEGALDYITKPFSRKKIETIIEQQMRKLDPATE